MATQSQKPLPPAPQPSQAPQQSNSQQNGPGMNAFGFQKASLAGITVDELLKNKTALTMMLHYYHQLSDENGALKNDLNTATTYVTGYQSKKTRTRLGAVLQGMSAIPLGFSINILTGGVDAIQATGWMVLVVGVGLQVAGLFYAFSEEG